MKRRPKLLLCAPDYWAGIWAAPLAAGGIELVVFGRDRFEPAAIDYALSFRPPAGLLKSLTGLKAIFSLGAGVDGFFADPGYPSQIPLVRFVDPTLSREMATYVMLHTLIFHRGQRALDAAQARGVWLQAMLPRRTEETHVGILGLGEIGTFCAERLRDLGFQVSGWSRSRKQIEGIRSFVGNEEFPAFLARAQILICLLPLTGDTRGILCARTFGMLPKGAYLINAARGGHQVEKDILAAVDSGQLAGATLDVFETEPLPLDSPLWKHPKITITPHIAAISDPAASVQMVLDGISRFERGEPLANVVDAARGY
ncbi:MAG: glyoxylate/hydroxypyruvate reductase A [Alphaproteobacteria bacterium]|nr:glyoxylate/hydroxypyruvate reductase A [Alphaproteobacteria bacterium]